jgi:hypothetical protein
MDRNVNAKIRAELTRSRGGLSRSEQNARLDHAASLRRIGAVWAKHQAGGRAAGADMRDFRPGKEDLVLIGRRKGDRPSVAAGPVQQIGRTGRGAAGRADVLETDRQADSRQGRIVPKL